MASSDPDPETDPQPDPEKARRTSDGLLWGCAGLTVLVGLFQLSGILTSSEPFGAAAWLGVTVGALCLLAMIAAYVLCAMNRLHLRTRVLGRLDVFQVTTVLMVIAIGAGVLVPTRSTTTLALLLPWGLTYWLNNLERTT